MPYTPAQCRKFAVMAGKGQTVPSDLKKYCRKKKANKKATKRKRS